MINRNHGRVSCVTMTIAAIALFAFSNGSYISTAQAVDLLPWSNNPWEFIDSSSGRVVNAISRVARDPNMFVTMDRLSLPAVPHSCLDPLVVAAFSEDLIDVGSRLAKYRMVARWHMLRRRGCEVIHNNRERFQEIDPAVNTLCERYIPRFMVSSESQSSVAVRRNLTRLELMTMQHLSAQNRYDDGQYNTSQWESVRLGPGQQTVQPHELPVFRVDLPSVSGLPAAPSGRLLTASLRQVRAFGHRALDSTVLQMVRRGACGSADGRSLPEVLWQDPTRSTMVDNVIESDYKRGAEQAPASTYVRKNLKDHYRGFLSQMLRRTPWGVLESCVRDVTDGPDGLLFGIVEHNLPMQCRSDGLSTPMVHGPEGGCELTYVVHLGSSFMSQARPSSGIRVDSLALVAGKRFATEVNHRIEVRSPYFKVIKTEPVSGVPGRDLQVSFAGSRTAILEYAARTFQNQCFLRH